MILHSYLQKTQYPYKPHPALLIFTNDLKLRKIPNTLTKEQFLTTNFKPTLSPSFSPISLLLFPRIILFCSSNLTKLLLVLNNDLFCINLHPLKGLYDLRKMFFAVLHIRFLKMNNDLYNKLIFSLVSTNVNLKKNIG